MNGGKNCMSESNVNIYREEWILKRQIQFIQTEEHFGDIKENENFRRFNYCSAEKVYKEFMLYAIDQNILKYHQFLHHEIEKYEGKKEQNPLSRLSYGAPLALQSKELLRPKIQGIKRKRQSNRKIAA